MPNMATTWKRIDQAAREQKRHWFAETKRGAKIAKKRTRGAWMAVVGAARRAAEQLWALRKPVLRTKRRARQLREQAGSHLAEWRVEREVRGDEPLLVGPWMSEVGFEVLYWIVFLRWVQRAFKLSPERVVAVSRGGVSAWYGDIAASYIDIFDLLTPDEFVRRNEERAAREGTLKHYEASDFDADLVAAVTTRLGVPTVRTLHPSLMYRLFRMFWSGHRPLGFLDSHTRYSRLALPAPTRPSGLPPRYVAVKFYAAKSLPDSEENRRYVKALVSRLARRLPVISLDTGMALDDHGDYRVGRDTQILSIRDVTTLTPQNNLAVQTDVIAGADAFVGTCGSLAWLAPMLGVDTVAAFADAKFLHSHLYVARRVYHLMQAGTFSPLDLNAMRTVGLGSDALGAPSAEART